MVGSVAGGIELMAAAGFILTDHGDEPVLLYPEGGAAPASLSAALQSCLALAKQLE